MSNQHLTNVLRVVTLAFLVCGVQLLRVPSDMMATLLGVAVPADATGAVDAAIRWCGAVCICMMYVCMSSYGEHGSRMTRRIVAHGLLLFVFIRIYSLTMNGGARAVDLGGNVALLAALIFGLYIQPEPKDIDAQQAAAAGKRQ